jgi:hypothetical protein
MNPIGFSTGALALGDFRRGVALCSAHHLPAIELSALRMGELAPLLSALPDLKLDAFSYISFHAPSALAAAADEKDLTGLLAEIAGRGWNIIVHPDVIQDRKLWRPLGPHLCIENMDKRKRVGRTAGELDSWFAAFPDATLCFDIAHAQQVDPTMCVAAEIIRKFRRRIVQLHISEVDTQSRHRPISIASSMAYPKVMGMLEDEGIPVILESVVTPDQIDDEVLVVQRVIEASARKAQLVTD